MKREAVRRKQKSKGIEEEKEEKRLEVIKEQASTCAT